MSVKLSVYFSYAGGLCWRETWNSSGLMTRALSEEDESKSCITGDPRVERSLDSLQCPFSKWSARWKITGLTPKPVIILIPEMEACPKKCVRRAESHCRHLTKLPDDRREHAAVCISGPWPHTPSGQCLSLFQLLKRFTVRNLWTVAVYLSS